MSRPSSTSGRHQDNSADPRSPQRTSGASHSAVCVPAPTTPITQRDTSQAAPAAQPPVTRHVVAPGATTPTVAPSLGEPQPPTSPQAMPQSARGHEVPPDSAPFVGMPPAAFTAPPSCTPFYPGGSSLFLPHASDADPHAVSVASARLATGTAGMPYPDPYSASNSSWAPIAPVIPSDRSVTVGYAPYHATAPTAPSVPSPPPLPPAPEPQVVVFPPNALPAGLTPPYHGAMLYGYWVPSWMPPYQGMGVRPTNPTAPPGPRQGCVTMSSSSPGNPTTSTRSRRRRRRGRAKPKQKPKDVSEASGDATGGMGVDASGAADLTPCESPVSDVETHIPHGSSSEASRSSTE